VQHRDGRELAFLTHRSPGLARAMSALNDQITG